MESYQNGQARCQSGGFGRILSIWAVAACGFFHQDGVSAHGKTSRPAKTERLFFVRQVNPAVATRGFIAKLPTRPGDCFNEVTRSAPAR